MNANDPNVGMIEIVVRHLGHLCNRFVFVGGCTTSLLITDKGRPPVRATTDVDVIVEVGTKADYYSLQRELVAAGCLENGDVICRWKVGGIDLDVMPTDEAILGFSNDWYGKAIESADTVHLPSGVPIRLVSPPLFLATKLEAFYGRGQNKYAESHDIEDIVTVVDGRPELVDEVRAADNDVRQYLRDEVEALLGIGDFTNTINWHFHGDPLNQARVPEVLRRLRNIAGL